MRATGARCLTLTGTTPVGLSSPHTHNECEVLCIAVAGRARGDTATDYSPVIRALRLTTDEVPFGRVLAALCQDTTVAAAFTSSVIKHAKRGNPAARRNVKRPTDDTCASASPCVRSARATRASRRAMRDKETSIRLVAFGDRSRDI